MALDGVSRLDRVVSKIADAAALDPRHVLRLLVGDRHRGDEPGLFDGRASEVPQQVFGQRVPVIRIPAHNRRRNQCHEQCADSDTYCLGGLHGTDSVKVTPVLENFDRTHSGGGRGVLEVEFDRFVGVVLDVKVQAVVPSVVLQVADVHQHIKPVGGENLPDVPVLVHLHLRVPDVLVVSHSYRLQPLSGFAEERLKPDCVLCRDLPQCILSSLLCVGQIAKADKKR